MSNVLIISGHPNLDESNANSTMLKSITERLKSVSVRRLDTLYTANPIDVEAEQAALLEADVIVLQFPFYWYSVPALLKRWIDQAFTYNFAFGPKGDKLANKHFILSISVGGPQESYGPLGYNHFSVEEFLRPLEQLAYLAKMQYHPPVYTHRMVYIEGVYNELSDVQARAEEHGECVAKAIDDLFASPELKIKRFVQAWFDRFDAMPASSDGFLPHLSEEVLWQSPEGEFRGHAGFNDWYAWARKTFKPGCEHRIDQVDITGSERGFEVSLRINLRAETFRDSDFVGEHVEVQVNERWQVHIDATGNVVIDEYVIIPLDN
ncbi:NAD(P)H-dependent oxidoreductase [Alteromonas sp. 009811495]|uniref:NAD(P)H-dependent oxidoreductase n=1 Tax=Alteromonas sp. 009811495 TaxID=3002962 RepID=UPI00237DEE21|nr:NAD(P)H-dependent oxidoreductase [Alteromonas sp. 009811495]WDT84512.1 NAD(P)H-dependent oxidoreductase [Alteromonas sp. 009811495]